jgi:hypothetical protein
MKYLLAIIIAPKSSTVYNNKRAYPRHCSDMVLMPVRDD